jgi:hypothetical protein
VLGFDSAGPSVTAALQTLGDVTQAVVALAMIAGAILLVLALLEPAKHERSLQSSAARYADAQGGVKAEPRQA